MRRFLGVLVAWTLVASTFAEDQIPQGIVKTFRTNNGYGVASVAGVTSRNGRVSSISSVNYFPSGTDPWTGLSFRPMARSGDKLPEPVSFSKEENGKYTAGTIQYGPGSVSVTSIARSIFPEDSTKIVKSKGSTAQTMMKPSIISSSISSSQFKPTDMIFPDPFATLSARSLMNPWFPNTFMFRQPFQSGNSMKSGWPYSSFNPFFNFWQR